MTDQTNTEGSPLSQLQKDLGKYAEERIENCVKDIVQAFKIADRPMADAVACVSSKLMAVSADLFVALNTKQERWQWMCNVIWDVSVKRFAKYQRAKG